MFRRAETPQEPTTRIVGGTKHHTTTRQRGQVLQPMRKLNTWGEEPPTGTRKGGGRIDDASMKKRGARSDAFVPENLPWEEKILVAHFVQKWQNDTAMDLADRLQQKKFEKQADDVVDQLAQCVDRVAIYSEVERRFTPRQMQKLKKAITEMKEVIRTPRRPTTGGMRRERVGTREVRAAIAWLNGESSDLEDLLEGFDPREVSAIEDRAGWMIGTERTEVPAKLNRRQLQLMLRVEERYAKEARRRQLLQMTVEAAEVVDEYPPFERGERIVGGKGGLCHEYTVREHVRALNERGDRERGHICHDICDGQRRGGG